MHADDAPPGEGSWQRLSSERFPLEDMEPSAHEKLVEGCFAFFELSASLAPGPRVGAGVIQRSGTSADPINLVLRMRP